MNRGASSSQTTQYEKSAKKGPRVIKFAFTNNEITSKLKQLILIDKNIDPDNRELKEKVREENIRKDYSQMAYELLTELLPFELPTEESIIKQQTELKRLLRKMQAARGSKPEHTSTEDQKNVRAFKEEKNRLKILDATLESIKEINQYILSEASLKKLAEHLEDYCEARRDGINYGTEDYWPDNTREHVNKVLVGAKTKILEKFPMNFSENDAEFTANFNLLPRELTNLYQIRYAQSIILLKNSELAAISSPKDPVVQKNYLKEQILYSAQISQLQHDILNEMTKNNTKSDYVKKVIDAALDPILAQFARGEHFGAYTFKYPASVKEQLEGILQAKRDLLLRREENEIKLEFYTEQLACFNELAKNSIKYGITTEEEGKPYENLARDAYAKCEEARALQAKLNNKLAKIIEKFIDRNTIKENQDNISVIQSKLGRKATHQNLSEIMSEAEKNTELGYYDWMFTKTFASRCKKALLTATTMGVVGAGVGGVAGLGIFSAFTAGVGGVGGGLTGLVTGFMAPNIEQAASSNMGELRNLAVAFFYGEENAILKEFFEDPSNTKVLAKKYSPTPRMIQAWGVDGANMIAYQYANLLFELHINILYESDAQKKDILEQKYKHFYRNYQMIRGDHAEIRKIYQGEFWGPDRAESEISKLERLNIKEQASDDLAALMMIVTSEEQTNIRKLRTVINDFADGLEMLKIEGGPKLLEQALLAPEVTKLALDFGQDVPKLLMITDVSSVEEPQPSSSSSPASSSSSPVSSSSSSVSSSAYPLALVPTVSQQMVTYDPAALERQQLVTQVKRSAREFVQAHQKRQEIHDQYVKIDILATIARGADTTTSDMESTNHGFIRAHTQFIGDMSAFDAASFMHHKQSYFKYWYNNIFLFNHKSSSNATRKEVISRALRDGNGFVEFEGKSIWHILAENSVEGRKLFIQMMIEQEKAGFSPFIDYFDFDYKANNGMNAIVYAASLSSRNNSAIFRAYAEELMKGYKSGTEHQVNFDKTFKEVLRLKSPQNPAYHIICMKLKDEIHTLWKRKDEEQYAQKSYRERIYSAVSSGTVFDSDAVLSQLLATMAIHCTEGNPIPQTKAELIEFLNMYKESRYISNDMATLLNRIEDVVHIAEVTQEVTKNNPLYDFAKDHPDEKIKNLAIELCTSMPIPTPDEQAILIAILNNNHEHIQQLISNKNPTLTRLVNSNIKFKERNVIWIAIEANRPHIAAMLYRNSSFHPAMDQAGPDNASAFTFAASREDKTACTMICEILKDRTGYMERAYLVRFLPSQTGEIAFHYLAKSGQIYSIIEYFKTEIRYKTPNWHRLTGGPDKGKYYTDQMQNLPLHLLLSRSDAVDVLREITAFVFSNSKLNSLFDFFAFETFEHRNSEGITPMSVIMQNDSLVSLFFEPLLEKTATMYADPLFRDRLFASARSALEHENDRLLEKIMAHIAVAHKNNIGLGYRTNPVELEVDNFLDYLISRLSKSPSERERRTIVEILKTNAMLCSSTKLKSMVNADSNLVNQLIRQTVLPIAIERKIVADTGTLATASSISSSSSMHSSTSESPSIVPSVSLDRTDNAPTRGSLLLSGGHQIPEREEPSVSAASDVKSKKKQKHDPT